MPVGERAIYAETHPDERHDHERSARPLHAAAAALAWLFAVIAVAAGVGVLYLLLEGHLFTAGPRIGGALPLEELAASGSQPLARMVVAWLPTGVAAGIALGVATRVRAATAAAGCALIATVMLGVSTVASEAVIHNERFGRHVGSALARPAVWVAVALIASGALLGAALARAPRQAGSSAAGAGESSAA